MKVSFPRALAVAAILVAVPALHSASDYQCMAADGCIALLSTENGTRKVKFRKGDVVSTESGWVVNPADGWDPLD